MRLIKEDNEQLRRKIREERRSVESRNSLGYTDLDNILANIQQVGPEEVKQLVNQLKEKDEIISQMQREFEDL